MKKLFTILGLLAISLSSFSTANADSIDCRDYILEASLPKAFLSDREVMIQNLGVTVRTGMAYDQITSSEFVANGSRLVVSGFLGSVFDVQIFDVTTGKTIRKLAAARSSKTAVSPDGKLIANSDMDRVLVLDVDSGEVVWLKTTSLGGFLLKGKSVRFSAGSGALQLKGLLKTEVYDARTGVLNAVFPN